MTYHGFSIGQRVRVGEGWVYGTVTGIIEKSAACYAFMVRLDRGGFRECQASELRAVRRVRRKDHADAT